MANSYKPGKWSGSISADLRGDASKTTPTLGDDFDTELANLKSAQKKVKAIIGKIKKEVNALQSDKQTGKMATDYLKSTKKRLDKIENSMDSAVNQLSSAVNSAQKAEWNRMRKVFLQWEAAQK